MRTLLPGTLSPRGCWLSKCLTATRASWGGWTPRRQFLQNLGDLMRNSLWFLKHLTPESPSDTRGSVTRKVPVSVRLSLCPAGETGTFPSNLLSRLLTFHLRLRRMLVNILQKVSVKQYMSRDAWWAHKNKQRLCRLWPKSRKGPKVCLSDGELQGHTTVRHGTWSLPCGRAPRGNTKAPAWWTLCAILTDRGTVAGRTMGPSHVCALTPGPCEYVKKMFFC